MTFAPSIVALESASWKGPRFCDLGHPLPGIVQQLGKLTTPWASFLPPVLLPQTPHIYGRCSSNMSPGLCLLLAVKDRTLSLLNRPDASWLRGIPGASTHEPICAPGPLT